MDNTKPNPVGETEQQMNERLGVTQVWKPIPLSDASEQMLADKTQPETPTNESIASAAAHRYANGFNLAGTGGHKIKVAAFIEGYRFAHTTINEPETPGNQEVPEQERYLRTEIAKLRAENDRLKALYDENCQLKAFNAELRNVAQSSRELLSKSKEGDGDLLDLIRHLMTEHDTLQSAYSELKDKSAGTIQLVKTLIDQTIALHPYKQPGNPDSYTNYNQGWEDGLSHLDSKIDQIAPVAAGQSQTANEYANSIIPEDQINTDWLFEGKDVWAHIKSAFIAGQNSVVSKTESTDNWIPVSERLPEPDTEVLVIYGKYFYDVAKYTKVFKMEFVANAVCISNVTHWQPLPGKPKQQTT